MPDIEGQWVPETDDEVQFLVQIHGITAEAHRRGVSTEAIVSGLNFYAANIALHDPSEEDGPFEMPMGASEGPVDDGKREDCPQCGDAIEDVQVFLGGQAIVNPCGCHVRHTDVEGWVDTPGDDGE